MDLSAPILGFLTRRAGRRQAGNSDLLASLWFRLFWRWRSRLRNPGRPSISREALQLIPRMKADNPCGVHRVFGELLQLGLAVSEPTVSRYLWRLKRCPDEGKAKRWLAFLN